VAPVAPFPAGLRHAFYWTAIIHDIAVMLMGLFALRESPRTILLALPDSYNLAWAGILVIGGAISLTGVYLGNVRWESTGCMVVIGAKLVWVGAALTPQVEIVGTEVLAMALVAGAAGTAWRILGLFAGQYLRMGSGTG
jgi:hypothetical protein